MKGEKISERKNEGRNNKEVKSRSLRLTEKIKISERRSEGSNKEVFKSFNTPFSGLVMVDTSQGMFDTFLSFFPTQLLNH